MKIHLHFYSFRNTERAEEVEIFPCGRQGPCMAKTMAAGDLAMQGTKASAELLLAKFSWIIHVSAPAGLNH